MAKRKKEEMKQLVSELIQKRSDAARILGERGGIRRAKVLTKEQRSEIARKASTARWDRVRAEKAAAS